MKIEFLKEQAEIALSNKTKELDYKQAMTELAEASAQLRAIQSLRKHIKKYSSWYMVQIW